MVNTLIGRTNRPNPERGQDVPSLEEMACIKKQAFDMFNGDKDTDVVMPDGQVVPSIAKAVDLIISNS